MIIAHFFCVLNVNLCSFVKSWLKGDLFIGDFFVLIFYVLFKQ